MAKVFFKYVVNHEIIHAYHNLLLNQGVITGAQKGLYSEAVAYAYNLAYSNYHGIKSQLPLIRSKLTNLSSRPEIMSWHNLTYLLNLW